MKKIFTSLLLLTFCTIQTTWAGDVIIISSDGQARYEDESKNLNYNKPTKEVIMDKKNKVLNEVNIIVENGESKQLLVDNNGKIKKLIDNKQPVDINKFISKEQNEIFQNYINNATNVITSDSYPKFNNNLQNGDYGYEKINLLDGDYAITFRNKEGYNYPDIAEYHKNGELMGFVKKEYIKHSTSNVTKVYYEYRIGYNSKEGA